MKINMRKAVFIFSLLCIYHTSSAQFLMDMIDTTKEIGKTTYKTIDRYNHIRISGYMQPQYQVASEKGANTAYSGGSFSPGADNRFMLRRGRLRFDYAKVDGLNRNQLQFVFQLMEPNVVYLFGIFGAVTGRINGRNYLLLLVCLPGHSVLK
jgi:hypothetical protein